MAKGAVLCSTCSGSGLYVDAIMESQGIIVKVRCLGKVLSYILVGANSILISVTCHYLLLDYLLRVDFV